MMLLSGMKNGGDSYINIQSNDKKTTLFQGFTLEQFCINDTFNLDIIFTNDKIYMRSLHYFINGNELRSTIFNINKKTFHKIEPKNVNIDKYLVVAIKNEIWLRKKGIQKLYSDKIDKPHIEKYLAPYCNTIKRFEENNSVLTSKINFIIDPDNLSDIFVDKANINTKRFYEILNDIDIGDYLNCSICYDELFKKEKNFDKTYEEFIDNKHDLLENIKVIDDKSFCIAECCSLCICSNCAISLIIEENKNIFDKTTYVKNSYVNPFVKGLKHKCPQCRKCKVDKFKSNFIELE